MLDKDYLAKTLTVSEMELAKGLYMEFSDAGFSQFKAIGMLYRSAFRSGVESEKSRQQKRYTREEVDQIVQAEADRRVAQALATYKAKVQNPQQKMEGEPANE